MNRIVAGMLGEAADVADPEAVQPAASPEEPVQLDVQNPTVEQLQALWDSGQHEAVALRVLDALDMYADFLELAFRIGHDDAIELGQIMDAMTSGEKSPHKYDQVPNQDISAKYPRSTTGMGTGAGNAHSAVGE